MNMTVGQQDTQTCWWRISDPVHHDHVRATDAWDAMTTAYYRIPADYDFQEGTPVDAGYPNQVTIALLETADGWAVYELTDTTGEFNPIRVEVEAHPVENGCGTPHTG